MSTFDPELLERARASYLRLTDVASKLNTASDEMGTSVSLLDESLKKLNLGIEAWFAYDEFEDPQNGSWADRRIGYAKIGTKWGIALTKAAGNYNYPEGDESERWLFNDAPRNLRLEAINHIPALIDTLIKQAEATVEKVREKSNATLALAQAISPQGTTLRDLGNVKPKAGKLNG